MKKILVTDSVNEKCSEKLSSAGFEVKYQTNILMEDLLKIIPNLNLLVVRSSTQVGAELISKMENMELIGRAGARVDNIDVLGVTRKGILVMNTPGGNIISAAEHTMAILLAMAKKFLRQTFRFT